MAPPFTETAGGSPTYVLTDSTLVPGVNSFNDLPIQPLNSQHVVSILSGPSAGQTVDITGQTATTLTIADPVTMAAGVDTFGVYHVASTFGPNYPMGANAPLCATLTAEPGYGLVPLVPGQTVLTAFVSSNVDVTGTGPPAIPAFASDWAPLDWRLNEVADTDGDGIPDVFDNCINVVNGPVLDIESPASPTSGCYTVVGGVFGQQLDGFYSVSSTGPDGYGNPCDMDFGPAPPGFDGLHTGADVGPFITAIGNSEPKADVNCDGLLTGADVGPGITALGNSPSPGPSGLWCAGTVPCP